jgi:hypothetical protein
MLLGLPDPHPDPLVTSKDLNADPLWILSFFDKSVKQTEIMVAK